MEGIRQEEILPLLEERFKALVENEKAEEA